MWCQRNTRPAWQKTMNYLGLKAGWMQYYAQEQPLDTVLYNRPLRAIWHRRVVMMHTSLVPFREGGRQMDERCFLNHQPCHNRLYFQTIPHLLKKRRKEKKVLHFLYSMFTFLTISFIIFFYYFFLQGPSYTANHHSRWGQIFVTNKCQNK